MKGHILVLFGSQRVRFGTQSVRFGIYESLSGPFRFPESPFRYSESPFRYPRKSISVRSVPFRSVSVNRDTVPAVDDHPHLWRTVLFLFLLVTEMINF